MNATAGKIIIDGNAACALGCMFAGVTVVTWYPITPSSSLVESLIGYMRRFRHDPETGKATYAIVQAEDELASIGMALGARMGGRALHDRHRRPGHLADVGIHRPGLLRRNSRGGLRRGTRRPLHRTAHAHPAGRHAHQRRSSRTATPSTPCSSPARPRSASPCPSRLSISPRSFQTPVFVMTDLDLGMNNWMADAVRLSRKAHRPRQGARPPKISTGWAASPATKMWMAMASAIARCPAPTTRRRRTSPAAAATTKRPSTPSARTITSTIWTAWRTSSKSCASIPRSRWCTIAENAEDRLRRFRHFRLRGARKLRPVARASTVSTPVTCASEAIPLPSHLQDFIRASRPRLRGGSESRRASCWPSCGWNSTRDLIAKLRSMRYYGGLPLDARTVTDEIVRQEGK